MRKVKSAHVVAKLLKELLVYTETEWRAFEERPTGPPDLVREAVWILER